MRPQAQIAHSVDGTNLADLLERILDKGIVIAGDIKIKIVEVELLTIQLRLVVCSVDRAREMGLDWWKREPTLVGPRRPLEEKTPIASIDAGEAAALERRIADLEARLGERI